MTTVLISACRLNSRLSTALSFPVLLSIIVIATTHGDDRINAKDVRDSINSGVRFLRDVQNDDGSFPQAAPQHRSGVTALCALALLNAGEDSKGPALAKSIQLVSDIPSEHLSTYTASLRIMVLCLADPKAHRQQIASDVKWLTEMQIQDGASTGGWGYGNEFGDSTADASNSQFAILALHEARQIGLPVPEQVWQRAKIYWDNTCDAKSGGFFYRPNIRNDPYGSMTCAGISSLIIIEENLIDPRDAVTPEGNIICCRNARKNDKVTKAIGWLAKHFSVQRNPEQDVMTKFYYLYGLERAGRISGRRFFGEFDWYRLGAAHLIKTQNKASGAWKGNGGLGEDSESIATSFALLFLSKGRRPIVVGKYQHADADEDWDMHPQGVHYLIRNTELQWNQKFNWQTIDGRKATVDDLHEAPVLFISGRDRLDLSPEQKKSLKAYLDSGGFIFAEAAQGDGCGQNVEFDRKFRELVAELFPDNRLEQLPESHPIWNSHFKLLPSNNRPLLGVQASCRTSLVYCPRNLAGLWELNQPNWMAKYPDNAKREIDYVTQLGINVLAYATGRQLNEKGDTPRVLADKKGGPTSRLIHVPKLDHGGGSDDAPNAWRNMLTRFEFDMQMAVDKQKIMVRPELAELQKYPLLFMHGQMSFQFSDAQRADLKEYLDGGGFLFIDCICASKNFAESVRREFKTIYPAIELQPMGADHPCWTDQFYGYDVRQVTLHTPDVNPDGTATTRERKTHPAFEMLTLENGRPVVFFSPYDLSCAMENAAASQCTGYNKADASKIAVNVVLFALQNAESKVSEPAKQ